MARRDVLQALVVRIGEVGQKRDERVALLLAAATAGDKAAFRKLTRSSNSTSTTRG